MKNTKAETTSYATGSPTITPETPALEEQVRLRAYQLYEQRGDAPGDAVSDWLQAEQEIVSTRSKERMRAAA